MSTPIRPDDLLTRCFMAGVAAARPDLALTTALPAAGPSAAPVFLVAVGKASLGMTCAMVEWLAAHQREPAGGLIIGTAEGRSPHHALQVMMGDHPIPGERSAGAADAIGTLIAALPMAAEMHVAISGGASALIAGPLPTLTMDDVTTTFVELLSSGLDIGEMNAVRKRVTRWSAGRLAKALAPRSVSTWLVSDVPGDDPATIGSGPCAGDPATTAQVRALITKVGAASRLPRAVMTAMLQETAKPGDPALAHVTTAIIASNRTALHGATAEGARLGVEARRVDERLGGEARSVGHDIGERLRRWRGPRSLVVRGGETMVTIHGPSGRGGRSQELALAAARELRGAPPGTALLAAGTDGRDGPTDAAGAIVDGSTWERIVAAGIDPQAALEGHDAYMALDAVGALLKIGETGTNVADLVIEIRDATSAP